MKYEEVESVKVIDEDVEKRKKSEDVEELVE